MTSRLTFRRVTHSAWRVMYNLGWTKTELDDTIRSRVAHAVGDWSRWYDWGHPAMWLVGRYDAGSAGVPRGRDMWWIPTEHVEGIHASLLADFEVRRDCYVTKSYSDVATTRDIPWRIFDLQDDGRTVKLALYPCAPEHDGRLQPLPWQELTAQQTRLFIEWYLIDHKLEAQWLGLRPWVYYKALHAVVHDKKPFSCAAVPDRQSGGYSNWHCQLRKRHGGDHRFRNYTWSGPGSRVQHQPQQASA